MIELKIESHIPVPRFKSNRINFILKMRAGDSFFLENKNDVQNWRGAVLYYNKCNSENKIQIVTRRDGDGFRIWRYK